MLLHVSQSVCDCFSLRLSLSLTLSEDTVRLDLGDCAGRRRRHSRAV